MKILFLTIGNPVVASSRVRVYGYIPYLEKKGIDCRVINYTSKGKCDRILNLKNDGILQRIFELFYKLCVLTGLLVCARGYDLIFLQKTIIPAPAWRALRMLNKRIVFDFDDAIHLHKDISRTISGSASVIVSNSYLEEFALRHNKNVHVVPSPVNVDDNVKRKSGDRLVVGWVGSPETSRYLNFLKPVFRDLKERFSNLDLSFMGALGNDEFEKLGVKLVPWTRDGERDYLRNIDIGIMPLADDEWSRAKAGYKLLLYMSKGAPCVASPVGVNKEIIKEGENGFLANTAEEWSEKLSTLLGDSGLSSRMGEEGRRRAKKYFSYDMIFPRLYGVLISCALPQDNS